MRNLKMLAMLLSISSFMACGPTRPHGTGGGHGKGGSSGEGGSAGSAGAGGSAGTDGGTHCQPGVHEPGETCDPGCVGEECLSQYCAVTHRFLAHAAPGDRAKLPVAAGTVDSYRCFTFKNPFFGTDIQVTAETPIIDAGNPPVLHRYSLWGRSASRGGAPPPVDDGVSGSGCVEPELNDHLLSRWAQGGTSYVLGRDIGLEVNQYEYLILQAHYNNLSQADQADGSGVAFCTTPKPRKYAAGMVALGTDNIMVPGGANDVVGGTGICGTGGGDAGAEEGLAKAGQSVYVIASSPHMHKLGSGFTTTQTRDGQVVGTLSSIPNGTWKFDGQQKYLLPRVEVRPGDVLTTKCVYKNPSPIFAAFGIGTTSEMCYDFLLVYPKSAARAECGQGITFDPQL